MRLHNQVLASRLLTRSGDQAWDFALPVTLVSLFPKDFSLIAIIFLATKLGQFIFQPTVSDIIDRWRRSHTAYVGTTTQLLSVLFAVFCLYVLQNVRAPSSTEITFSKDWMFISGIVFASILSTLGSGVMDIAVGNDWIPTLTPSEELARTNSHLKQIDLFTEVLSPILAGLLLTFSSNTSPLLGFSLVALWNILSFFPEILILRRVFHRAPALQERPAPLTNVSIGIVRKTINGWQDFSRHSAAPAMVAYAFLWLSVLSPHGVLLTSFLKGGWQLSELTLGIFRGSGAIFGLIATLVFPIVVKRIGVLQGTLAFICLQATLLLCALPFFFNRALGGVVFLGLVLLSRIGLYGFSLGEMEIRQRTIALGERGKINGVASALTSFATLILFGAGTQISSHGQFLWLVLLSVASVCIGATVFFFWYRKQRGRILPFGTGTLN